MTPLERFTVAHPIVIVGGVFGADWSADVLVHDGMKPGTLDVDQCVAWANEMNIPFDDGAHMVDGSSENPSFSWPVYVAMRRK